MIGIGRPAAIAARSGRPSHRSGRADFPHPVPRAMGSLRFDVGVDNPRPGQWPAPEDPLHLFPVDIGVPRSPAQPLLPDAGDFAVKPGEGAVVTGDTKVTVVPSQLRSQLPLLLSYRGVPVSPAVFPDSLQRTREPALASLPLHRPVPFPGATPVMGEPQKVERVQGSPTASEDAAFECAETLGTGIAFSGLNAAARPFACLRFNRLVTATAARLATGLLARL